MQKSFYSSFPEPFIGALPRLLVGLVWGIESCPDGSKRATANGSQADLA
jgi:hypothetical protein